MSYPFTVRREPGWVEIENVDPSKRRGVWFRVVGNAVEFCAGREGDDAFISIDPAAFDQPAALAGLREIFSYASYAHELAADEPEPR